MEHAIFISDIPELKHFQISDFQRIYYGNEFCELLLPSERQLEAVLEFALQKNVSLTLVTPVLYDAGMKRAEKLIARLPGGTEVVVNDLGLLTAVASRDLVPVHGRMLFSSIRDPRINRKTPFQEFFTAHNLQAPYLEMLKEHRIQRVEIDNARQGYDLKTIAGMSISIYYPHVYCTVTRKCVFANKKAERPARRAAAGFVVECDRKCDGRILKADIDGSPVSIMGNAQFYTNDVPPENLDSPGVDRLVYTPVFPNSNTGAGDAGLLDWSFPYKTGEHKRSWGTLPDITLEKLVKSISLPGTKRVLDIGCGAGRNAPTLLGANFHYTGIDIAAEAIALARRKLPRCDYRLADATDYDWAGAKFDAAIDYGCFHTLPPRKRKKYFEMINRILDPGGYLIIAAWDGATTVTPIEYVCGTLPEWACSKDEFVKIAGPEFEITHTESRKEGKWLIRYYVARKSSAGCNQPENDK